ncbi:hypothetical protein [Gordonia liuliyuniae]|uniref:DUF1837 domain-containing protein n=1 Tax=Gordonia liuliyuniae TaxID=2911517 RepID=A0ABS9IWH6_9ACTN|nr:hypothetical protein [Gordonia liuliyuniae]MCF8589913.1 hypothetical protein [Gordonia liuliyuniae]
MSGTSTPAKKSAKKAANNVAATSAAKAKAVVPEPVPIPIPAVLALATASAQGDRLDAFTDSALDDAGIGGVCRWHSAKVLALPDDERAAIAWIVAQAVMRSRTGGNNAFDVWHTAITTKTKLSGKDARLVELFIDDVFGLPGGIKPPADHLLGHVGEWLWYLHLSEFAEDHRSILNLESPKFGVTEQGADGLALYESLTGEDTSFCLWEMKKLTGTSPMSGTTGKAYRQLRENGGKYLAKLTKSYAEQPGLVGQLGSELAELWVEQSSRAGVGVSVATDRVPPEAAPFTTMGTHFPQFDSPGQLEGLLLTVEDLWQLAVTVRKYLWTAL